MKFSISRSTALVSMVAVIAATSLVLTPNWTPVTGTYSGAAWADESGGQDSGKGHQEGQGKGGQGAQSGQGQHEDRGQGQGGPSSDSEGKGPQAGVPAGSTGGKPAWAQEGIPEVELGRLNVARAPDRVLNQAYAEAVASITPDMVAFYNLPYEEMTDQLANNWDGVTFIDSPLQNLALLKDALDGTSSLADLGVTTDVKTLAAVFLGTASDKTVPITVETVVAVTTILGMPVTGDEAEALAAKAEAIRSAVLTGHDS